MKKQTVIKVGLLVLFGALCFIGGRYTINEKTDIVFVKLPTIHVEQKGDSLKPVSERVSDSIKLVYVYRSDTVRVPEIERGTPETASITPVVDTLASLWATARDYNTERTYESVALDNDTLGVISWRARVQYNTLTYISHDVTPVMKQTSLIKKREFVPFVLGSYNTFNQLKVGAGVFKGDNGIFIDYVKDVTNNKQALEFGIIRKF